MIKRAKIEREFSDDIGERKAEVDRTIRFNGNGGRRETALFYPKIGKCEQSYFLFPTAVGERQAGSGLNN